MLLSLSVIHKHSNSTLSPLVKNVNERQNYYVHQINITPQLKQHLTSSNFPTHGLKPAPGRATRAGDDVAKQVGNAKEFLNVTSREDAVRQKEKSCDVNSELELEVATARVLRLLEALAGKNVIGAAASEYHTAVWTDDTAGRGLGAGGASCMYGPPGGNVQTIPFAGGTLGGLFLSTFGGGGEASLIPLGEGPACTCGKLGRRHGREENESVPRLVEALAGKNVIGASAGDDHTAVWTDERELFTFGAGYQGRLGHGEEEDASALRLVEALLDA